MSVGLLYTFVSRRDMCLTIYTTSRKGSLPFPFLLGVQIVKHTMSQTSIPNNSFTFILAFQIALQNEGQREVAQTYRSRARNSDGNHGNPPAVSFGSFNFGPGSRVNFTGYQKGGTNLNAPKQN